MSDGEFQGLMVAALITAVVLVSPLYAVFLYGLWKKDFTIMERALVKVGIGARYVFGGIDWLYQLIGRTYVPFMLGFSVAALGMFQSFHRSPEQWLSMPAGSESMMFLALLMLLAVMRMIWYVVFNGVFIDD